MNAEGELVDVGLLATEIEDANLGVGDTTVEARLRVRLLSIAVSGMFSLVVVVHFPSPHTPIPSSFALQVLQRFSSVCGDRQNISYLVLAVAVTSRGTTGHFDGISEGRLAWVRRVLEEAWASISSGARAKGAKARIDFQSRCASDQAHVTYEPGRSESDPEIPRKERVRELK